MFIQEPMQQELQIPGLFLAKAGNLKGIGVSGDPGVADAVKKDMNGIGYNNTLFVFDAAVGKAAGIEVVPIDVNGNGTIDADENFYGNLHQFLKAVNDGKYPSPPARNLTFSQKVKHRKRGSTRFLQVGFNRRAKMVNDGYVPLPKGVLADQIKKSAK